MAKKKYNKFQILNSQAGNLTQHIEASFSNVEITKPNQNHRHHHQIQLQTLEVPGGVVKSF